MVSARLCCSLHSGGGRSFKLVGARIVHPDGSATEFEKGSILQLDADDSYTFSTKKLNLFRPREARIGDTLAWEYDSKSRPEVWVDAWAFGDDAPTVVSRYGIKLPVGWKQEHVLHNAPVVDPKTDDDGYLVWEMRNLPALDHEPMDFAGPRSALPILIVSTGPTMEPRTRSIHSRAGKASGDGTPTSFRHRRWPTIRSAGQPPISQ